jgi:hypothetical protein
MRTYRRKLFQVQTYLSQATRHTPSIQCCLQFYSLKVSRHTKCVLLHVTLHLTLLPSISDTVSLKHTPTFIPCKEINKPNFLAETSISGKHNSSVPPSSLKSPSVTSFNLFLPPATYLCQNWQSESVIVWTTSSLLG